ncbi:MAG: LysM peptidoglycan-binding domain-containing protein [Xanthobacteraceae bacterium]|nr:MAG: LysM peptidoglycan-binding domain-containing protein [Xanthobacteraceae bacterium]
MSRAVELLRSRHLPSMTALALVSMTFAGCSSDIGRFSDNPFSSPFASRQSEATASVAPAQAAPVNRVDSQPLPQHALASPPQSYPVQQTGLTGGGRGLGSYTPPASPLESTGTVPQSVAATQSWSRDGGTAIIVGTSDTIDVLAKRYKVPAAAIIQANRMSSPRALQPGQQLIIPRRTAVAAAPVNAAAPVTHPAPAPAPTAVPSHHTVGRGDTLMNVGRRYKISAAKIARANNIAPTAQLRIGDKLVIPGGTVATAKPASSTQVAAVAPVAAAPEPAQKVRLASAAPAADPVEASPAVKAAEATGGLPSFRWPVRGRVIAGYGAKTDGKQNDGINLAVPEGTPVKAAEDGVVAYSGNELKGYGNLVLVRHANGYVTAYAHASELMVKRGDTIKRGQIIAKSGQTGEVGSPQLHFEIRKGSAPVDPQKFLNGG